jgi:hypothetical protein
MMHEPTNHTHPGSGSGERAKKSLAFPDRRYVGILPVIVKTQWQSGRSTGSSRRGHKGPEAADMVLDSGSANAGPDLLTMIP